MTKASWSIVVVYENTEARDSAVSFCDRLVEKFWIKSGLDVSWWTFAALEDSATAGRAAERARGADWIVFATAASGELPAHLRNCVRIWLGRRDDREGTVVSLQASPPPGDGATSSAAVFLRERAHAAGMDFLTQLPENVPEPISDSRESYTERAQQVTSVLHDILRRPVTSSRIRL